MPCASCARFLAVALACAFPAHASALPWEAWSSPSALTPLDAREQVLECSSYCPGGCRYDRDRAGPEGLPANGTLTAACVAAPPANRSSSAVVLWARSCASGRVVVSGSGDRCAFLCRPFHCADAGFAAEHAGQRQHAAFRGGTGARSRGFERRLRRLRAEHACAGTAHRAQQCGQDAECLHRQCRSSALVSVHLPPAAAGRGRDEFHAAGVLASWFAASGMSDAASADRRRAASGLHHTPRHNL